MQRLKKLNIQETEYFIIAYKPAGYRLHKVSDQQLGLVEVLSEKLQQPLFIVHDMSTALSGPIVLAKSKNLVTEFSDLKTQSHQLQFKLYEKNYCFTLEIFPQSSLPLTNELRQAWEVLNQLYLLEPHQCYRLIHESRLEIQADIYGPVLWVYWYATEPPTETQQKEVFDFGKSVHKTACIRHMINRGHGVGGQEKEKLFFDSDTPMAWTAEENGIQYQLKQNSGFSPGLFLDQSENRSWVLHQSRGKKVLNLFSYTSGFSVAAALGHAQEVTTVDVSPSFLDWSKKNFELNAMNPLGYEFFCQDVPLFLSGALKRKRQWDLIICDPPSFGRSKTQLWKIEKDLPTLAVSLQKCLAPKGVILFTCNYEQWTLRHLIENFTQKLKKGSYRIQSLPAPSLDITLPDASTNLTKGFLFQLL